MAPSTEHGADPGGRIGEAAERASQQVRDSAYVRLLRDRIVALEADSGPASIMRTAPAVPKDAAVTEEWKAQMVSAMLAMGEATSQAMEALSPAHEELLRLPKVVGDLALSDTDFHGNGAGSTADSAASRKAIAEKAWDASQTTMRVNYQPILYARNVRQCVRICAMDKEVLRTGVRARVTFEFMYRPEFLQPGTKVLFTEGKTKAIGTIVELLGASAEEKPAAPRSTAHGHGGQGTGAGASKERKSGEADASRQ